MGGNTRGRGWENTLWKSRIWQTCGIRLLCRQRGRSGRGPLETAIRHGERMWELVCWLLFFKRGRKKETLMTTLLSHGPSFSCLSWVLPAHFLAFFSCSHGQRKRWCCFTPGASEMGSPANLSQYEMLCVVLH